MPRLREEFDADLIKTNEPTYYRTGRNSFELRCSVCGRRLFVDEATFEGVNKALTHDLDNTIVCGDCEQVYDNIAFE